MFFDLVNKAYPLIKFYSQPGFNPTNLRSCIYTKPCVHLKFLILKKRYNTSFDHFFSICKYCFIIFLATSEWIPHCDGKGPFCRLDMDDFLENCFNSCTRFIYSLTIIVVLILILEVCVTIHDATSQISVLINGELPGCSSFGNPFVIGA